MWIFIVEVKIILYNDDILYKAADIVRIYAERPMIYPIEIAIKYFRNENYEYAYKPFLYFE